MIDTKDAFGQNTSSLAQLTRFISPIQKDVEPQRWGWDGLPSGTKSLTLCHLETEGRGPIPQGSNHTQSRSAGHMMDPS